MSDDLVKRLRAAAKHPMMDNNCKADVFDVADAADRIEELEKACKEWADVSQSNYQRAKAAEAKLAKMLVVGDTMAASIEGNYYVSGIAKIWRDLAEMKGKYDE